MRGISQRDAVSTECINSVVCEDGYRLCYRLWPAASQAAATIILVNGMMSHSGWFRELAYLLAGCQLDVVGADRRGSGLNECDRGDAPSRHMLLSDLRRIMVSEDQGTPNYLVGWCWGALLAVNLALELGQNLSGLVLLAPGLFPSQQIRGAAREELIASRNADTRSPVLRSPLTEKMFSDRIAVQDFIRNDGLAQRMFTPRFFHITGEMSLIAAARLAQLTQPVLLLMARYDKTVDREQTLRAFQQLPRPAVTTATLACNHGMQFEVPEEIVAQILQWLQPPCGVAFQP